MLIALSNGHGINTPGKRTPKFKDGSFMHEYEFNSAVVKYLDILLKNNGFDTLLVSPTDEDIPLKQRTDLANDNNVDLFISVHVNAYGSGDWNNTGGIETYVYKFGGEAEKLARLVHKNLLKGTPLPDRKVKEANFHVLRETKMPAILVECGFMTNEKEAKLLISDKYRQECAEEIAQGICEYYGKEYVDIENNFYIGKSIVNEVPILVDGELIDIKALMIENGGITMLPIRSFLQDILRDKWGIELNVGWNSIKGMITIDRKK